MDNKPLNEHQSEFSLFKVHLTRSFEIKECIGNAVL